MVTALTEKFKLTGESVWQTDYIRIALANQSHSKCSFCECELGVESKYLEVEHFACKHDCPDKVLQWENLLAACRRCNGKKGRHDVRAEPIVNPFNDDPRIHIKMRAYRMHAITTIGETTISLLNLNDVSRAIKARFDIGNEIFDSLDGIRARIELFKASRTALRRTKIINAMEAILNECQATAPYAAAAATILHKESSYPDIREELLALQLWTIACENMHNSSFSLVLIP